MKTIPSWPPYSFPSITVFFYSICQQTSQQVRCTWCSLPLTPFPLFWSNQAFDFLTLLGRVSSRSPVTSHYHIQWSILSPHLDLSFISGQTTSSFFLSHFPHFIPRIIVFLQFQAILFVGSSHLPNLRRDAPELRHWNLPSNYSHSVRSHPSLFIVSVTACADDSPSYTSILHLFFQLQNTGPSAWHSYLVVRVHIQLPQPDLGYGDPSSNFLLSQFYHLSKRHQRSLHFL